MLQHYKDGKLRKELHRAPSKEEEVMIIDYVMKHFKTIVSIARYPDQNSYLTIEDQDRLKQQEVSNWVSSQLQNYLKSNYPEYWEDSLEQHCSNQNVKVTPLKETSQLW